MEIRRAVIVALVLLGASVGIALALRGPEGATRPSEPPSASASRAAFARPDAAAFMDRRGPASGAAPSAYGWILSDTSGIVVRREDEIAPAAVLRDIRAVTPSPSARHLSYWTVEAHGVRQLHVFDTITLAPPLVVFETEEVTKLLPAYSPDERFALLAVAPTGDRARLVDLASGDATELALPATYQLGGWSDAGVVLRRPGSLALTLWDLRTGALSDVAQDDPRVSRTPAPTFDPGSALAQVDRRVARPDGSAMTYLSFDSSHGGRWYGERVDRSGARVAVDWSTGGNPVAEIFVGRSGGSKVFESAPPRDADGKVGEARALWLVRQNVTGPIRREAVRAMPYREFSAFDRVVSSQIDPDLVVYAVYLLTPGPMQTRAGTIQCGVTFALLRSDDRAEGTGGGCDGLTWPATLPPAFATPDPLDWASPLGPATPGPASK